MTLRPHPRRRQAGVQRPQQLGHVVVSDRNAFGRTGGAGGVDQVRDAVRVGQRQRGVRQGIDARIVDVDDGHGAAGEPLRQLGGGDGGDRFGVAEHELDAGLRGRRVDGQVGRPRLEHREDGGDRLGGSRKQQCHSLSRAGAGRGQAMRQPVRRLVELPVGHRQVVADQRHRLRHPGHLGGEQFGHRHPPARRPGQNRRVANLFQVSALGIVEQIHRGQRPARIARHRLQHPPQPFDQRLDGGRVEHVGAEFHPPADAGEFAVGVPAFGQREHQVHPGGLVVHRHRRHVEVTQCQSGRGVVVPGEVLPGQHHLHQRVMRQAAGRVEPLHQHLERNVLMLEGGQAAGLNQGQQLGEAGVAGQVDPQHQRVDEEADQLVERRVAPPGDREAHRHIGTRADLGQQHRQGGLHHHEAGGVVFTRDPAHLLLQLGGPVDRHAVAALVGRRRVGPVGGQRQPLGHAGQRVLPVGQLGADAAVGVVEITELGALPQRVIAVLHRQVGPSRGMPGAPAGVRLTQVDAQRRQRHAVGGDVVDDDHQYVLVLGYREKLCADWYFGGQVEGVAGDVLDGVIQPVGRPIGGIDDVPTEFGALGGYHQLAGRPLVRREHGAQALVPGHHVAQRRTQRPGVEPAPQPQRRGHVVQR
ncbi:hypothetical protein PICSAR11_04025 [Mycobacterium avium subsp. paratuberculosis]|nr:hypothetical protein PICSAR103_00191 [Mycobacterium avium subsp. paratuberculosis]CAG6852862.1 hypothetical protein PICSAR100_00193 [Mycobacterium avium subsp. paratuberculosis]CAG6875862.1 hypothetical protein PICSAR118_01427 [Mycobacterium avium subsp. paratuberculosis]CAG6926973.1 hypothetical protein PICSAR10_03914 [Mycobacterium avium subsp. paratuberculosis]CAG6927987.1 hypothetical protein PICSAR11_04025 [Mycobacterium avium subsp. paratuberculosis]